MYQVNIMFKMKIIHIIDHQRINRKTCPTGSIYKLSFSLFRSCPQEDPLRIHVPPVVLPTPPSSPHMELLRQQYAYFLANSTTSPNLYLPSNYDCVMAQKVLAQQFLDNYRTFLEQQQQQPLYSNPSSGYGLVEGRR